MYSLTVIIHSRHPAPPQTNFDQLKEALAPHGIQLQSDNSKQLAESLDKAQSVKDPYFNRLVRILTTRCMMQAVYFCSGTMADNEFWHYGLAAPIYTHFTSPIRRYSDVMVHRLLWASIDPEQAAVNARHLLDRVKVVEICENLNYRHRMAQHASRSSVELYTNLFFRGKTMTDQEGYVTRVLKNGFSVLVPKYGVESFVHVDTEEEFYFDSEKNILVRQRQNGVIGVFTKVKVQITIDDSSVAGLRQRLRMTCTEIFQ